MNIISLDLELNKAPTGAKIIQVGAVVGNLETGEILEEMDYIINPNEQLTEFIIKLTTITQDMVDSGTTLINAVNKLKELREKYQCFRNMLTWGGGDTVALRSQTIEEINANGVSFLEWPFGDRWVDAKTVYQTYCFANSVSYKSGLAKSLTRLGLNFKGTKHYAVDDARNTFIIYMELLKRFGLKNERK